METNRPLMSGFQVHFWPKIMWSSRQNRQKTCYQITSLKNPKISQPRSIPKSSNSRAFGRVEINMFILFLREAKCHKKTQKRKIKK